MLRRAQLWDRILSVHLSYSRYAKNLYILRKTLACPACIILSACFTCTSFLHWTECSCILHTFVQELAWTSVHETCIAFLNVCPGYLTVLSLQVFWQRKPWKLVYLWSLLSRRAFHQAVVWLLTTSKRVAFSSLWKSLGELAVIFLCSLHLIFMLVSLMMAQTFSLGDHPNLK